MSDNTVPSRPPVLLLPTAAGLSLNRLDCGFGFAVSTTGGMMAKPSSHMRPLLKCGKAGRKALSAATFGRPPRIVEVTK